MLAALGLQFAFGHLFEPGGCAVDPYKFGAIGSSPDIPHLRVCRPLLHQRYENCLEPVAPKICGGPVQRVQVAIVLAANDPFYRRGSGNEEGIVLHFLVHGAQLLGHQLCLARHFLRREIIGERLGALRNGNAHDDGRQERNAAADKNDLLAQCGQRQFGESRAPVVQLSHSFPQSLRLQNVSRGREAR